jgi:hypothetical protein
VGRNRKYDDNPSTDYYTAGQEMEGFVRGLFKKALGREAQLQQGEKPGEE